MSDKVHIKLVITRPGKKSEVHDVDAIDDEYTQEALDNIIAWIEPLNQTEI